MAAQSSRGERDLVLCVRVRLLSGAKLAVKDIRTSDPYAKVWVGPKSMLEPPERGLYISTCQESTLNPVWGEGRKISKMTKDLYKTFKDIMIPLTETKQDEWNFLWKEGHAIHIQLWDRDVGSADDYMGNVSFVPDISKKGAQKVTEQVHNGPPGQMRSKEKVSGTITIEWEWATKTDQLNIDQWIPVLQKLTYGDDRALSFLRQEDLLPHMSVAAARFILGEIAKGKVVLPATDISFEAGTIIRHPSRQQAESTVNDWEKELLDDDDDSDDDDAREPDGIVFLNLGSKVISIEYTEPDTLGDVKSQLANVAGVTASTITFTDAQGGAVSDDDSAAEFASLTLNVRSSQTSVEEIAVRFEKNSAAGASGPSAGPSSSSSAGLVNPLSQSAIMKTVDSDPIPTLARAQSTVPGSSSQLGTITQLAVMLFNQDFEKMTRTLAALPLDELVIVSPILVACKSPEVLAVIKAKCAESQPFANRCRMIQNTRTQFSHLDPVVGAFPLSSFLNKFLSPDLSFNQGDSFQITSVHPLTNEPITDVKVVKIFSSLARPSILMFSNNGQPASPGCLFKRGEDLYNETCLQVLFQFMNELWDNLLPPEVRPRIFGLRELPGNNDRGFLEIVPEVRDLEVVERGNMELIKLEADDNFIRTSCGWILAAYFLGLSDRHRENTLVRITDGSAIPIDFGFILGNQPPSYNTFCITISPDMYKYLLRKEKWISFSLMFLSGWWAVRTRAQEFIRLAIHLFAGTDRNLETSARFISHRMMMGKDMPTAMTKIYGNLRHAPICFYTRKKIEGHAKSKKIPARDDFIGSLARKIGANAAKPTKAEKKTGEHYHPGKVPLHLPMQYPASMPGDLTAILSSIARSKAK